MDKLFGKMVRDKVTGFTGIAIGKTKWMFGCDQYCVSPLVDNDGKKRDSEWFDKGRIEIIGEGVVPEEVQSEKPGGVDFHPSECRM